MLRCCGACLPLLCRDTEAHLRAYLERSRLDCTKGLSSAWPGEVPVGKALPCSYVYAALILKLSGWRATSLCTDAISKMQLNFLCTLSKKQKKGGKDTLKNCFILNTLNLPRFLKYVKSTRLTAIQRRLEKKTQLLVQVKFGNGRLMITYLGS